MKIRTKLSIAFLATASVVAAISLVGISLINANVVEIVERENPKVQAVLEMEINLKEGAKEILEILRYTPNLERETEEFRDSLADFEHFQKQYKALIRTQEEQALQLQVDQLVAEYIALADQLIKLQEDLVNKIKERRMILNEHPGANIEQSLQSLKQHLNPLDPDFLLKHQSLLELEINVHKLIAAEQGYILMRENIQTERVANSIQDFERWLQRYNNTRLSDAEVEMISSVAKDFQKVKVLSQEILIHEYEKQDKSELFEDIVDQKLDSLLDDQVQHMAMQRIKEDEESVQSVILYTLFSIFGASLLAVMLGGLLSRPHTRSIMELQDTAKKIGRGQNVTSIKVKEEMDEMDGLVASFNKMAEDLKSSQQQLAHQAFHDGLTTLPNRAMLMQTLALTLKQIKDHGGEAAILFIDVDDFKLVNDTLGHNIGDELLCQTAGRLKSVLRDTDFVARQGGDEFIILLRRYVKQKDEAKLDQEAAIVAKRILEKMQKPFLIEGQEAFVSASIGISLYPSDSEDATELIQNADIAMYHAKELGRGNFQYFSQGLSECQQKKMSLATMLHKALEHQEFILHYQPIIDLSNDRVVGVEALIRWESEKGNLVSPAEFLPIAEDTGLILPIGEWVVREACLQLREWSDKGMSLNVAINLSVKQMWHGNIANQILNTIYETGISKDMVDLEVTESAMVIDPERMERILEIFKENNIKISIDDFGTGYSSLDRLKHLPFNKLKIDKSFVAGLPDDKDDVAIVSATVYLARSLGLSSLAEGVETVEQLDFLKSIGCDFAQGYYFSRPVLAQEIERYMSKSDIEPLEAEHTTTNS